MMLGTSVQQTGLCNFTVTVCLKFSSHTFSCLEYINDNKAILEKNLSSMAFAERTTRVKIWAGGTCGSSGRDYEVPEKRNCLLSVRQLD